MSERQRSILEEMARARATSRGLSDRARIVLASAEGVCNLEQARRMQVDRRQIRRWRERWAEQQFALAAAEQEGAADKDLRKRICEVLSDRPRPGAPPHFTPEQVTAIIALACEDPKDGGLPVSHWTPPELAREAIKRGLVDSISPRHVDRFLKGGRPSASQEPALADVA